MESKTLSENTMCVCVCGYGENVGSYGVKSIEHWNNNNKKSGQNDPIRKC